MQWFLLAEKLLKEERIFSSYDLPYSTQLVPLSAVCTVLMDGNRIHTTSVKKMVKQWYWCGVFGELYGSANETRYANDIVQVVKWINNGGNLPKTVTDFYFNPMRLLGLQSRQSAAYKGMMALILKIMPGILFLVQKWISQPFRTKGLIFITYSQRITASRKAMTNANGIVL